MEKGRTSRRQPTSDTSTERVATPSTGTLEHENPKVEFVFTIGSFSEPLEKSKKRGRGDQDRGYFNPETGTALIADGMGAVTGGEAADTVVQSVAMQTQPKFLDGLSPDEAKDHIEATLRRANGELVSATDSREIEPGSGCTLTGVIPFTDTSGRNLVAIINVGDSATFGVENISGTTEKLTEDETVAMRYYSQGKSIPEHIESGNPRGMITNAFGAGGNKLKIHPQTVNILPLDEYNRFVITSDGIENLYTDQLNYPETRQWFAEQVADMSKSPQQLADLLGSKDAEKTDDKLIYVVDVTPTQPKVDDRDTLSFGLGHGKNPAELPDDRDDDVGHPTLGADADFEPFDESDEGESDAFTDWEFLFPDANEGEGTPADIEPDDPFSHLPPPPDNPYSHLPPPPDEGLVLPRDSDSDDDNSSASTGSSASGSLPRFPLPTPEPETAQEANLSLLISDVEYLRNSVAKLHNRKLWGVAGITRRKQMSRLQSEYSDRSRELTNVILMGEFSESDPTLSHEELTAQITARKIELLADEARAYARSRNETELNRYGRLVRRAGDIFYGTERKLGRRVGVGVAMGAGALAIGAITGPAALLALPVIRLTKAATAGVAGHDSKAGSLETHNRVLEKNIKKMKRTAQEGYVAENEAGQLVDSVRRSDSRRRALAIGSQALALGAVMQAAPVVREITDHIRLPHIGIHNGSGSAGGYKNLSARDIQDFKHANPGITESTLHTIDKDPEAFNRLVRTSQRIHDETGLQGAALSQRLTDTLALSHAKNEFLHDAAGRGISAQAAGQAFDDRMARLVFSDAVSHIKASTGLSGDALLRRVQDTAALSQIRDQFINQATSPSERFQRGRLFDEQFTQFVQQFQR